MDGRYLPHHPFDPAAPPESRDVPLIISTTLEDAALRLTNWDLNDAGLTALLNERYNGKASEILELYRSASAGKTPYLVQAQVFTDTQTRLRAITQAERKAAQGGAGVWMYIWEWATPGFDGKLGAVHGHDVDASFNLYRNGICGSGRKEGRLMCTRLASSWIAFAKTGNPDNEHIPHWPTYDAHDARDDDVRHEHEGGQRSARRDPAVLESASGQDRGGGLGTRDWGLVGAGAGASSAGRRRRS